MILFDHGYKQVSGVLGLTETWKSRLYAAFVSGADHHPLQSKHKRRTAYTNKLDATHPGYIHELYRYAEKTLGYQASFDNITRTMNKKSDLAPFLSTYGTVVNVIRITVCEPRSEVNLGV